jgi:hypothetical protein
MIHKISYALPYLVDIDFQYSTFSDNDLPTQNYEELHMLTLFFKLLRERPNTSGRTSNQLWQNHVTENFYH